MDHDRFYTLRLEYDGKGTSRFYAKNADDPGDPVLLLTVTGRSIMKPIDIFS